MTLYRDAEERKEYSQSVITYRPYEKSKFEDALSMTIDQQEEYDGVIEPLKTMCPSFVNELLHGRDTSEDYYFPIAFQGLLGESSRMQDFVEPLFARSRYSVEPFESIVCEYMRPFEDTYFKMENFNPLHFSSHSSQVYNAIRENLGFDEGGNFNTRKQLPYEDLVKEIFAEPLPATEWKRRQKLVRLTLELCMRIALICNFIRLFNLSPATMVTMNLKKLNVHPFNPNFEDVILDATTEARRYSNDEGFTSNRDGVENVTNCWRPYGIDYAKAIINSEHRGYAVVKDVYTPIFAFRDNSIKKKGTGIDIYYSPMCSQNHYRYGERPMYSIGNASTMDKAIEKAKVFCTECLMLQHKCTDDCSCIDSDTGGLGINLLYTYEEIGLTPEECIERMTNLIRHHVYVFPPEYREMAGRFLNKHLHFDINNPVFGGNYGRETT